MINKVREIAEALGDVKDGSTVLIGGFGAVGQPDWLVGGLLEQGAKDLTIVVNNAGWSRDVGVPLLLDNGRVRKIVCSFPKNSPAFDDLFRAGRIELEITPQGTLAERIRAGGAGIPAFFTATGVGTQMAIGKEVRTFGERDYLMETAINGDLALIEAWRADRWGNLSYRGSGRNFNPVMATAAVKTVAQVHGIVELGGIAPDAVATPGIFVDSVVPLPEQVRA